MQTPGTLQAWRDDVGRRYLNLDFKPAGDAPFHLNLDLHFVHGDMRLARLRHSAGHTFRDRELIEKDSDACFSLLMPRLGLLNVSHQRRSYDVTVNDATVVHNCQPGHVGGAKTGDFSALILPEASLKRFEINGASLVGGIWRKSNGAFQLLKGYIACLTRAPPTAGEDVRAAAANHIIELTALAAREALNQKRDPDDEFESVRAARFQIALQHIASNLHDPGLRATHVAASQGVSVRYLHVLFEVAGLQFSTYVNERRLQRVYDALSDTGSAHLAIADIALAAGFSDVSHFNRLFRRRYGCTPSAIRSGPGKN